MAAIDQTKNEAFDICWARGDNDPKTFTLRDAAGNPLNISTWTLSMAVNTDKDPTNTTNQIFQVAGVFVTDGTDGQVSFTPPALSLDNVVAPGQAFYDINRVTPSVKTLVKGKVIFIMDIDKS
jgi:hypothetical protein